jgi:cytoskeletal protein CcmA (bactofilin family)
MSFLLRRAPASTSPDAERSVAPASQLGKALTVRGVLDTDGELRVEGAVIGRINAANFVLGVSGFVEGDVHARDARIGGKFNGRIYAVNVAIDSSAEITGRVFHHNVTVASGARIDGRMPWRPLNFFESLDHPSEE